MNYKGLYDVNYKYIDNNYVIHLFIRNEDGTKQVILIKDFLPYLYVNTKTIGEINKRADAIGLIKGHKTDLYKTIFGEDMQKIFIKYPNANYWFGKAFGRHNFCELDVDFSTRFCIDKVDEVEPTKYKVLYFDIETDTEHGFSVKGNPIIPIISISAYDNYSKKNITFVWRNDQVDRQEEDVYYYSSEEKMLVAFMKYWKEQNADIITAWNVGFDIGYLVHRLLHLNLIKINTKSYETIFKPCDLGEIKIRTKGQIEIFGKVIFDLLRAYDKMHFGELDSKALNNVAQSELGEEKEKVHNTGDAWREKTLDKLISYNRKDVELIYKIDEKCKLIKIFDDIKRFAGVRNINECFSASRIHETKIMKKFRDLVFPNKPPFQEKSKETMIKGAFVKEPVPGIYKNVAVLDFKSLYPSIIYTFNLSKEMVSETEGSLINGIRIKQSPKGIMPSMIKELVQLKDDMKKEVAGTGQNISDKMFAIKTFINSFYGINALTSFRLYDKQVAGSITSIGQSIIKQLISEIEDSFGYRVLYGDTDSVFVEIPTEDKKDAVDIANNMLEKLNEKVVDMIEKLGGDVSNSTVQLEFEKLFSIIMFGAKANSKTLEGAKKRYVGKIAWDDDDGFKDKIKIVGMAARRADTPEVSKRMQTKLFDMILNEEPKEKCINYINKLISDITSNIITKEEVAQPVKLNGPIEEYKVQNSPKIRGVKWSNSNINTSFSAGNKFKMIYVDHPETSVICFEEDDEIKDFKIDWNTQLDKCVFQKIKSIFETLGWKEDYDKIKLAQTLSSIGQQTLGSFGITNDNFHNTK